MATFRKCINNGTIAIVPEAVYEAVEVQNEWAMRVQLETDGREPTEYPDYPKPVFTFVRADHLNPDLHLKDYVTGSYELMDTLLKGHTVLEGDFHVPFSNCLEINEGPLRDKERAFRTTLQQAVVEFELDRASRES